VILFRVAMSGERPTPCRFEQPLPCNSTESKTRAAMKERDSPSECPKALRHYRKHPTLCKKFMKQDSNFNSPTSSLFTSYHPQQHGWFCTLSPSIYPVRLSRLSKSSAEADILAHCLPLFPSVPQWEPTLLQVCLGVHMCTCILPFSDLQPG
jgi:hypothetical protein